MNGWKRIGTPRLLASSRISFHLKSVDESAYHTAIKYVDAENNRTWTIVVNYVSEGAFFKLKEKIKASFPYPLIMSFTNQTSVFLIFQDAQTHLKELRFKIINWLTLHLNTLKAEIHTNDSNKCSQIETKIR
jgi:hypothetical protein